MVGKAQKSHGARSELNSVFGLENVDQRNPIRTSAIQSRSHLHLLPKSRMCGAIPPLPQYHFMAKRKKSLSLPGIEVRSFSP
jgi:hypothetical protein